MYLNSFVVDHGVDCYGSCLVVGSVGLLPEFGSPRGSHDGKDGVSSHGSSRDEGKLQAVLIG